MLRQRRNGELVVSVKLEEPLTSDSCCKLILELVKYLLYQKQQIPVTYEYLIRMGGSSDGVNGSNLAMARATLTSLQRISDHLNTELCRGDAVIKEITISMGATILSPKFCVRVALPLGILSGRRHCSQHHPPRKPLLNLMRSMTESKEFQEAMTSPLAPTNTIILIKKSDNDKVSEFFLPKPHYIPPNGTMGKHICINLSHQLQYSSNCNCVGRVRIYHDQDLSCSDLGTSQTSVEVENSENNLRWYEDSAYQWYQSKDIIKGFKFSR